MDRQWLIFWMRKKEPSGRLPPHYLNAFVGIQGSLFLPDFFPWLYYNYRFSNPPNFLPYKPNQLVFNSVTYLSVKTSSEICVLFLLYYPLSSLYGVMCLYALCVQASLSFFVVFFMSNSLFILLYEMGQFPLPFSFFCSTLFFLSIQTELFCGTIYFNGYTYPTSYSLSLCYSLYFSVYIISTSVSYTNVKFLR